MPVVDQGDYSAVLYIVASNKTDVEKTIDLKRLNLPFASTVAKAVPWIIRNSPVLLPEIIEYECCPNGCLLFWKEHAEATKCAECGAHRYFLSGKPACVYPYIPLIPRIRRMYASRKWSQIIHDQYNRSTTEGCLSDVADGSLFKDIMTQVNYSKYTMPFYFGVDGITMDSQQKLSVDPIALVNLFLPPEMRTKSVHTWCCGITPPNMDNIKIFLQPLLEELSSEFQVFDAMDDQWHTCAPLLVFGTFDMRGLPKATMGNTPPAKVMCHECTFKGSWCPSSHTTVYMGHYVYLSNKEVSTRKRCHDACLPDAQLPPQTGPPPKRTQGSTRRAGAMADSSDLDKDNKNHPCKIWFMQGSEYFSQYLPYWHPVRCLCVDPMHCFKNKGVDWSTFTVGQKGASKPKRQAMKNAQFHSRTGILPLQFQLTPSECKFVNDSCTSHSVPRTFGSNLRAFLSAEHIGFLKCHDWKMVFSQLGVYHMRRAFLGRPRYRDWFFGFSMWSYKVHRRRCSLLSRYLSFYSLSLLFSLIYIHT